MFQKRREHLDLSYSKLNKIPTKVLQQKGLKSLSLSGNSITEISAKTASKLPELQSLDMSGNNLRLLPESFGTNLSSSLTRINLSFNYFNSMPYAAIYSLEALRSLDLSKNGISQLPDGISALRRLEIINISHNNIQYVTPEINSLIFLHTLDVSNNQLQNKKFPTVLSEMRSLRLLDLSFNEFTLLPEGLVTIPNLKELLMSHCKLKKLQPAVIKSLVRLSTADFSFNLDLKKIPREITELHTLSMINMKGNERARWPMRTRNMVNLKVDVADLVKGIGLNSPSPTSPESKVSDIPHLSAQNSVLSPSSIVKRDAEAVEEILSIHEQLNSPIKKSRVDSIGSRGYSHSTNSKSPSRPSTLASFISGHGSPTMYQYQQNHKMTSLLQVPPPRRREQSENAQSIIQESPEEKFVRKHNVEYRATEQRIEHVAPVAPPRRRKPGHAAK